MENNLKPESQEIQKIERLEQWFKEKRDQK